MLRRRRVSRRAGRRSMRRTARRRRGFRPTPRRGRRSAIRRPLGSLLILGATAGVAYKLGKNQAQKIQNYTGYPPDQLSEADLQTAMQDLNIQSEPLDEQDQLAVQSAQTSQLPLDSGGNDYIDELQRLAELRDTGVITSEEFDAKKQQLLGQ